MCKLTSVLLRTVKTQFTVPPFTSLKIIIDYILYTRYIYIAFKFINMPTGVGYFEWDHVQSHRRNHYINPKLWHKGSFIFYLISRGGFKMTTVDYGGGEGCMLIA